MNNELEPKYSSPVLAVFDICVEKGFAASGDTEPLEFGDNWLLY